MEHKDVKLKYYQFATKIENSISLPEITVTQQEILDIYNLLTGEIRKLESELEYDAISSLISIYPWEEDWRFSNRAYIAHYMRRIFTRYQKLYREKRMKQFQALDSFRWQPVICQDFAVMCCILSDEPNFDLHSAIRYAIQDFMHTATGKERFNSTPFTWSDIPELPSHICRKYHFDILRNMEAPLVSGIFYDLR